MDENERCPECGSYGEECVFPTAQPGCGCARCLRAQRDEARAEMERLRHALLTIERSGAPGASIAAKRNDGHACSWCRGMWTPCPTSVAEYALAGKGKL